MTRIYSISKTPLHSRREKIYSLKVQQLKLQEIKDSIAFTSAGKHSQGAWKFTINLQVLTLNAECCVGTWHVKKPNRLRSFQSFYPEVWGFVTNSSVIESIRERNRREKKSE